jgi:hypothetical protein
MMTAGPAKLYDPINTKARRDSRDAEKMEEDAALHE